MNKVIITGKSGFVGTNLSNYLTDNSYIVDCISLRNLNWKMKFSAPWPTEIQNIATKY